MSSEFGFDGTTLKILKIEDKNFLSKIINEKHKSLKENQLNDRLKKLKIERSLIDKKINELEAIIHKRTLSGFI